MKEIFSKILILIFCSVILILGIRGLPGNPSSEEINQVEWKDNGPLELSPERGRYALTYSLVEDKSFHFSVPLARFTTPDLGYKNGKYVSLFAPAVSFIVAPGYIIGKLLSLAQVGTFSIIAVFAILNVLLIRSIAKILGANEKASTIAGFIFLFATPAFAYAVTLYQHHITTFVILFGIWLLLRSKSIFSLAMIWFLSAVSIPIDYPNLFFMLPIGFLALGRFLDLKIDVKNIKVKLYPLKILSLLAIILPLTFFLWFNKMSYGDPLQFSGTVDSVKAIDEQGKPKAPESASRENIEIYTNPEQQKKSAIGFFNTREIPELMYIHLFSPDRGVAFFTPIILMGIFGIYFLYKQNGKITALLIGVIGFNLLLYSMFGRGGWAFGSRYLIPSYAMMAIFIAIALTYLSKRLLFMLLFLVLSIYSISVNSLGAVTSNRNPPKVPKKIKRPSVVL